VENKIKYSSREAMLLAISEAQKGLTTVSPNPPVGAVIMDSQGHLISKGHHKKAGQPHAEIEALQGVSREKIENSHMFITLEPCSHHGRTPPCAAALSKLPFSSITYGLQDPNPLVAGQGVKILKAAGIITVQFRELQIELENLIEIFSYNMNEKKTFVAVKVATSRDGKIGRKDKPFPQWLTGDESREYAHYLRACYDAILVGRSTVEVDNPSLNIRHPIYKDKRNRVVILDPTARTWNTLKNSNIYRTHAASEIYLVQRSRDNEYESRIESGIHLVSCPYDEKSGFDLDLLKSELYREGICSLLVEGGVHTYGEFF
jgi:diaminohydroxyphosphoribosylaminopyrimidine deaminase/5-amino-6-(5-phosphoribosylamino)uracil reductase